MKFSEGHQASLSLTRCLKGVSRLSARLTLMIVLPFDLSPTLKIYQLKAFELGIIQGNEKSITPWIYNKYINQLYMTKDQRFTFTNYDRWHADEGVTECQKLCIKAEVLKSESGINIIKLIHEMIDTGHYVFGRYNEYYIPNKKSYQKEYYVHDFIIYGYDETKQLYFSAGYVSDGKYKPFVISFDNFYNSLKTVTTEKLNFHFIKYKNGINNCLDVRMIYEDLYDYLHSINRRNIINKDKIFGIDCELVFIEYLKQLSYVDEPYSIDMRHAKFFFEMKKLMNDRLKYIEEQHCFEAGVSVEYSEVRKKAELVSLLSLKYNLTGDKNLLTRIIDIQAEIINEEREILTYVLNQLKRWR